LTGLNPVQAAFDLSSPMHISIAIGVSVEARDKCSSDSCSLIFGQRESVSQERLIPQR
jgi:hypothetical protein